MSENGEEPGPSMPGWVPVVIGVVLVTIAGFAVYTGLRYRNDTLVDRVLQPRKPVPAQGGGSGFPGEGSEKTPDAREPVASRTRAEITGGGANGVVSTMRITARRGMVTRVVPEDAMVFVNDVSIGEAQQFNAPDETYDFPAAGSYTVRFVAPGFEERQFIVTVIDTAKTEVAVLDVKLEPTIR
jgi:hypothetical protein